MVNAIFINLSDKTSESAFSGVLYYQEGARVMRRSIQSFYIPLGTTHGHLAVVGTPWMGDWSLSWVGWGIWTNGVHKEFKSKEFAFVCKWVRVKLRHRRMMLNSEKPNSAPEIFIEFHNISWSHWELFYKKICDQVGHLNAICSRVGGGGGGILTNQSLRFQMPELTDATFL